MLHRVMVSLQPPPGGEGGRKEGNWDIGMRRVRRSASSGSQKQAIYE